MAFEWTFNGGVFVAAGDVNGAGRDDIIAGAGSTTAINGGQGPLVSIFDSLTFEEIDSFFTDDSDTLRGVFVAGSLRRRR